ncbi:MAG TPA: LysR family transcriptional regulator [Betaproteobacteria bacterium]|nr:LysR family transcriptional regulator [Betaproteobacteria bacterium]
MTLTELRYMVAVARERHFGRAAAACFVSQPTLSMGVRKLEDALGVAIFERGANDVRVTDIGQRIVEQAQHVLEEAAALEEIAGQAKDPLTGPLRLGAIYTIGPYLLPHLIPILHERAPNMPLLIEESFTASLSERLRRGELDAIIISYPFEVPGLVTQPLYDEPFRVALPADHPWRGKKAVAATALADETLLLLGAGHCFRDQVIKTCPALQRFSGGEIQKTLEGSSLETIRYMVASGMGVTVLPCTAAHQENRLLTFLPFSAPIPERRVALAWRKRFPRPEAVMAVREAIAACRLPCVTLLDLPPRPASG